MAKIRPCLLLFSTVLLLNLLSAESRSHELVRRSLDYSHEEDKEFNDQGFEDDNKYLNDEEDESIKDDSEEEEELLTPLEENKEPSIILTHSMNIQVKEGETAYLPCIVKNEGGVSWTKGKDTLLYLLTLKAGSDDRINKFDNNTMTIAKFSESDIGDYTCQLLKENLNITHHVDIIKPPSPPKVFTHDLKTTAREGEELIIECKSNGVPTPKIKWSLEGERIPEDNGNAVFVGQSVIIKKVDQKHAGAYQCLAENEVGHAHGSINIKVMYSPKIHIKKSVVNTAEGYEAVLSCNVHSYPLSLITWIKDQKLIRDESGVKYHITESKNHSTLKIKDVQPEDFGIYTCNATNVIGMTLEDIMLVKQPGRALWIGGSQNSIHTGPVLKWSVDSIQPLTNVEIKYFKMDESKPDQTEGEWIVEHPAIGIPTGNKYTIVHSLQGLTPGKYAAHLRAENEHGWSELSEKHTFDGDYLTNEILESRLVEAPVAEISSGAFSIITTTTSTASLFISSLVSYCLTRIL